MYTGQEMGRVVASHVGDYSWRELGKGGKKKNIITRRKINFTSANPKEIKLSI